MFAKSVILASIIGIVVCQIEQSIFGQLYYPPVPRNVAVKPRSESTTEVIMKMTDDSDTHNVPLEVLPLQRRFRRSGFGRDLERGGNNAAIERVRHLMDSSNWKPEILPRYGIQ